MYQDSQGFIIAVDKGPYGNWTFYRRPNPKARGKRVKVRNIPNFYPSFQEAEDALHEYAKTRNDWKRI